MERSIRLVALLLFAIVSVGATPTPPAPADPPPATVAGVTVHAFRGVTVRAKEKCFHPTRGGDRTPPHIVSTYPANGATIAPGVLILRVSFDQEMACGYSLVEFGGRPYPPCTTVVLLYPGRRIFRFRCETKPGVKYHLSLNSPEFLDFQNIWGVPSPPQALDFQTGDGPPITTVHDALLADPEYVAETAKGAS